MGGKVPDRKEESPVTASADEVEAFLQQVARMPQARKETGRCGRLIFSVDATMSRQPTWDMAQQLQAEMFLAAADIGGLEVQLVYYRGFNECKASPWLDDPRRLAAMMSRIDCRGGYTQIRRVLRHIRNQAQKLPIQAAVHIGDACEENIDELAHIAGEIALLGVPVFMFQEGHDPAAAAAFAEIARITSGAHCRFDQGSAAQLRRLLSAVATYAAGGLAALEDRAAADAGARLLLESMKRN